MRLWRQEVRYSEWLRRQRSEVQKCRRRVRLGLIVGEEMLELGTEAMKPVLEVGVELSTI